MGLTTGCAQCHTHKYDPITHKEYFGLFAILNNADELEIFGCKPEIEQRQQAIQGQIDLIVARLANNFPLDAGVVEKLNGDEEAIASVRQRTLDAAFRQWTLAYSKRAVNWRPIRPIRIESNLPTTKLLDDNSVLISGDVTKNDIYKLTFDVGSDPVDKNVLETIIHCHITE